MGVMAEYLPAINYVLENEGGYSNNPKDPGGATNFGILQRNWTHGDIRNLTRDQAIAWYEPNFWNRITYDLIGSQRVATKLLDIHVNCGLVSSVSVIQRAAGFRDIAVDGCFGPSTLQAVNSVDPQHLLGAMVIQLQQHYRDIELRNASLVVFHNGWSRRAQKLPV